MNNITDEEKYSNSKFLGYNYLRDRIGVKCRPIKYEIEKYLHEINFNETDFTNKAQEFFKEFIKKQNEIGEKYRYELIYDTAKLKYGFVHFDDLWHGWTTTHQEEHLFLHIDRYETEEEFIKRKNKKKKTLEEQLLHAEQVHLKEIKDAKEQLSKLNPDQLKEVLKGVNNE